MCGVAGLGEEVDVRHIAWLARIELGEEEVEEFRRLVRSVRKLIDKLLEANVEGLEPLYHPLEQEGLAREDKPLRGMGREEALMNAARVERGYVVAPRTVEES